MTILTGYGTADSAGPAAAAVFEIREDEKNISDEEHFRRTFSRRTILGVAISQIVLALIAMGCQVSE